MIFGLITLFWWTVASMNRAEQARIAAEQELTRRKSELQASLRDLELLMNHASELICSIDESGRVISVNAASLPLFGAEPEQMIGSRFIDLVHPEDRAQWESACQQVQTSFMDSPVTLRLRRRDETFATIVWSLRWSQYHRRLFGVGGSKALRNHCGRGITRYNVNLPVNCDRVLGCASSNLRYEPGFFTAIARSAHWPNANEVNKGRIFETLARAILRPRV